MSVGEPVLAASHLDVVRGGRAVVEDVSFEIGPGELLAVVGPNGAGKSTLFAALLGLVPARGTLRRPPVVAYVPQTGPHHRAFPVSALDVALMGAQARTPLLRRTRRADRELALRSLARVGLESESGRAFPELSGGQRQRVLLARALVQGGSALLLDEPLAGVDALSEAAIMRALDEERGEGRAVLMATHDLALARARATTALLLNRRAFAFGPPAHALTAETLRRAYGGRLIVLDEDGALGAMDEGSHCADEHGPGGHEHAPDGRLLPGVGERGGPA